MTNLVSTINVTKTKIEETVVSEVLLKTALIWPSMGTVFMADLASEITNKSILETREEMLNSLRRLYDAHESDPHANGESVLVVTPTYSPNAFGEGDKMSLEIKITACSGRSLKINISLKDNLSDVFDKSFEGELDYEEYILYSLEFDFPNPSSSSAGEVKKILTDAGVEFSVQHAEEPVHYQKSKLSKRTKKLLRLANQSKGVAYEESGSADYRLSNMIFSFLVQNKDFKDCKLVLYKERGETPRHDLLVLRHEDGEELRVPAPAWQKESGSVSDYRQDRKPVGKNKKDLRSDEGGEYYSSLSEKAYRHMAIMILHGGAKVADYTNWI